MESAQQRTPVILTLIHGTFDTNARWTDPDSTFSKIITERIGGDVLITKFKWSGRNSEGDRRAAAKQLLDHIAANSTYFPASPHFLVGHSHAGNIVRWALGSRTPQALKNVVAAVTVSTPFVEVTPRRFSDGIRLLCLVWRTVVTFALGLGWLAFFAAHFDLLANLFTPLFAAPIPLLVIYSFIKKVTLSAEATFLNSLEVRQHRIFGAISPYSEVTQPFLCIYTKLDEVALIFGGAHGLLNLSRMIETIVYLTRPSKAHIKKLAEVLGPFKGILVVIGGFAITFILISDMSGHDASGFLLFEYGAPVAVLGLLLGLAIPIAMAFGIWLYGTDAALDLLVVNFHITMRPADMRKVDVLVVSPVVAGIEGISGNVHTGILYGDEVASKIGIFVKELLASHSFRSDNEKV